ncbi:hypothetical protein IAU59_001032 [Kwoniella sp. CBS 9459]
MPPKRTIATASGQLSDDSFDEHDDLVDELDSGDEEVMDGTVDRKPKLKKKKPVTDIRLALQGRLQAPLHRIMNPRQLHDAIHFGLIELNPTYQRDVVWPEAKMIGLIQSLMLNYYVPPIIFSVATDSVTGEDTRVCIDGKQRLTSMSWFIDGKIPFVSPATKERFWYKKALHAKHGRQMPPQLMQHFEMLSIQVAEYRDMSDEQQRDVFQRVQLGVALTAAEKLQAIASPWSTWLLQLEKQYIIEDGTLGQALSWDTSRGKPFQNLLGFIMLAIDPTRHLTPSAANMKQFINRADEPEANFKARIKMALSLYVNLAVNHKDAAFGTIKSKRVSPVEWWFAGFMIYTRMGNLSLETIAHQIGQLRAKVHAEFPGHVFSNGQVTKFLYNEIKKLPKKRKHDEQPAAEQYEGDEDVDARNARAIKRSRRAEEDDPSYVGDKTERTIIAPETVKTRAQAANPAPAQPSDSAPTTTAGAVAGTGAAPRPVPVNTILAAQRTNSGSQLPTPQTSGSVQYGQPQQQIQAQGQVHNPQHAAYNGQPQQQYPSPTLATNQSPYLQQQQVAPPAYQQAGAGYQSPVQIANGQQMDSNQWRLYHQARANSQIQQAQQQQQQQQQQQAQGYNQYYGR